MSEKSKKELPPGFEIPKPKKYVPQTEEFDMLGDDDWNDYDDFEDDDEEGDGDDDEDDEEWTNIQM